MIHVKKSAQSLLVFMLFAGLCRVVSTASQPSASATNQLKKYACSWPGCIKVFAQKTDLTRHMRTHTGDKPFQCQTCNRKFSRKEHLEKHMKTHTGEKAFQCKICHTKFAEKSNLQVHMRTHTGKKPFQCPTCRKGFTIKGNLRTHMRTHTGKKPFQCKRCRKEFARNDYLKKHMNKKNPCELLDSNSPALAESTRKIAERAAVLDQGTRQARNQVSSELVLPEFLPLPPVQDHVESLPSLESYLCQPPALTDSPGEIAELAAVLNQGTRQARNQVSSELVLPELLPSLPPVQDHVESPPIPERYLYKPLQLDFKNKGILPADDPMDFFPDVDCQDKDDFLLHFLLKSQTESSQTSQSENNLGQQSPMQPIELPSLPVATGNDF